MNEPFRSTYHVYRLVQAFSAVPWDDANDSDSSSGSDDEKNTVEERRDGSATHAPQADQAFGSGEAVGQQPPSSMYHFFFRLDG